jgi:hypothetical protein
MSEKRIGYRKLTSYNYQLMEEYSDTIPVTPRADIDTPFVKLTVAGDLTLAKYYAWDGPSGPTIDTPTFMRGSLVHDALYQLMRLGMLEQDCRKAADDLLRDICVKDGMCRFRAWYVYWAVRFCGGKAAAPRPDPQVEVIWPP